MAIVILRKRAQEVPDLHRFFVERDPVADDGHSEHQSLQVTAASPRSGIVQGIQLDRLEVFPFARPIAQAEREPLQPVVKLLRIYSAARIADVGLGASDVASGASFPDLSCAWAIIASRSTLLPTTIPL